MKKIDFNNKVFVLLLVLVSIAFVLIIQPFIISILWACILAIAFWPVHQWFLQKMSNWPSIAALLSICVCIFVIVLPFIFLSIFLFKEMLSWYQSIDFSSLDFTTFINNIFSHLPNFILDTLKYFDLRSGQDVQDKLLASLSYAAQFLTSQVISLSQNAISFSVQIAIIIYLLFFLFRDGMSITERVEKLVPIDQVYLTKLLDNFITVVLATVKGTLVIAILQGVLGGIMLWCFGISNVILLTVVMIILSLLPVVGASLVWAPIAIYFITTGNIFEGLLLIALGVALIGTMDNFLRPLLVGKNTQLPDYVVLLTTIGGLYLFGFIGFVLGPVIAALFVSLWTFVGEIQTKQIDEQIYENKSKDNLGE